MITVLGMSKGQTAQILFAFNLCLMLCYLAIGWWAPRYVSQNGQRRWSVAQVVAVGLFGALVVQAAILGTSASWTWILWIVLACFVTVTTLIQSYVGLAFPVSLAGRAASAYNMALFSGTFLMQWGIGILIDAFTARGASPAEAMRGAFMVCLALQTVAWIAFMMNRAQAEPEVA
jgi:MFS family permease